MSARSVSGDHPRVRGEKIRRGLVRFQIEGSPPRARGKVSRCRFGVCLLGITPACAGKRSSTKCCPNSTRDHPRVRGEKADARRIHANRWGSPPRARGKACFSLLITSTKGITPACAGKSSLSTKFIGTPKDHPRVRGEKLRISYLAKRVPGSPPRARGKDGCRFYSVCQSGITPACAGKRL